MDIYEKAANEVYKEILKHMKKDGWPLTYFFYVEEIFYKAHGYHLENYLLPKILNSKEVTLNFINGVQIVKREKKRPRKTKRKSNTK